MKDFETGLDLRNSEFNRPWGNAGDSKSDKAFSPYAFQHVYQRAADHGVIFYSDEDRIVYYTLDAAAARKFGISVLAESIMFTHTHRTLRAKSLLSINKFIHSVGTSFARLYNAHYGRSGKLLCREPGIAQKKSSKAKRTNLIYVYNNHVEKQLCRFAEEERWSFLAYAKSDHPYSEPINYKSASKALLKALRLIDRRVLKQKSTDYADLDRILPQLNPVEREQFIDYLISHYALIDFDLAAKEFGGIDNMFTAIHASTGSEYSINEDYSSLQDIQYRELVDYARKNRILHKIHLLDNPVKADFAIDAAMSTSARPLHLARFFHLDFAESS